MRNSFKDILYNLRVPKEAVLYVHSSCNYLQKLGFSSTEILDTLLGVVGENGTLLMPSFPCDMKKIAEYLQENPVFDVCKTPTVTGLIPELFRRMEGVERSLHPWASVAAYGGEQEYILSSHHNDIDPFSLSSPFERILERDGILLGLGVSLNTNSFIHCVDNRVKELFPYPMYEPSVYKGMVKDRRGDLRRVSTLVVSAEIRSRIRPSFLFTAISPFSSWLRIFKIDGVLFFSIRLKPFIEYGVALAQSYLAKGLPPIWHAWSRCNKLVQ